MEKTLFDYDNYKTYIVEKIESSPAKGRGMKLKIAEFLNCQTAFISSVLNKDSNFSLEQGVKLNGFFNHNREEARFFLLLLQFERAGNFELKNFFKEEIKEILEKRSNLKERLGIKGTLKPVDQQVYYSNWLYTCIHIMISIPGFQTVSEIVKHLNVPREKVIEVLTFLVETGLADRKGTTYTIGVTRLHLSKDSPQIQRHHTNWRMQAIRAIDLNSPENLHYSTIVSMSVSDLPKVKEVLIKSIEECRKIIRDSKEERVQTICIDFFGN